MTSEIDDTNPKQIIVRPDGPYKVTGDVLLVHKTQVVSEYGEPLTWKKDGEIETEEHPFFLCRCGKSSDMPFCDSTHKRIPFDGTEQVDPLTTEQRQLIYPGSSKIRIKVDPMLCMSSGFCGMRRIGIAQLARQSEDTQLRSLAIAMIERCPSGSLTYSFGQGEPDIEPDLPEQVAVTVEITSEGPIQGPLWVTGKIPITLSDGQLLEQRNRVTLCNCGMSRHKPLCDGTHRSRPIYVKDEN